MLPVVAIFAWALIVNALCRSRRRWLVNLGGVLGFAGALVCLNVLFHIV
jgi:hypothetical protein